MSNYTFKRPDHLIHPQVYRRFQAKSLNSDKLVNYVISDLTEDRYEEAVNLMVKFFIGSETICSVAGLAHRPVAVREFRSFFKSNMQLQLSIGCICKANNELVGVNVLKVLSKDDPKVELKVNAS